MPLASGSRLGPYEVLSVLGAGGMGEVYRARDPRLGREVAIKVLPEESSADPDRLRRFDQEARATGALNHPNLLAVYDTGRHEGAPFVVFELLEGETLRERLAGKGLSAGRAVDYAIQIARGLAAAHEKGIVHRDLKPENLFVTLDERVKILDFGLAKLRSTLDAGAVAVDSPTASVLTEAGSILGTVGYMSPEQVRRSPADHRSDIFSFGAVLYEMLAGRRPFQAESTAEVMAAILNGEPPPLAPACASVTPALERIVRHCLEKAPAARFQSARDLAFNLESLTTDHVGSVHPRTEGTPAPEREAARGGHVDRVELAAAAGLAVLVAADQMLISRLVPPLAGFRAEFAERFSLPVRAYFTTAHWGRWALAVLALLWVAAVWRRPVLARARRTLLLATAGGVAVFSVLGLWLIAEEGVRAAVQQNLFFKGSVVNRELAALHVVAGEPGRALEILDPQHRRDYPKDELVWFGVPGHVFQMAEAYRASGDVEAARRLYQRAQEAATAFDETLSERELAREELWQEQFGLGLDWKLPVDRVRTLPDTLRAVAAQRLRQLAQDPPPPEPAAPPAR